MSIDNELDYINVQINELINKRNARLKIIRKECKHLNLVELQGSPRRICTHCGAEERGWFCGYHVLVMTGDPFDSPYKKERKLILTTSDPVIFYKYRLEGPLYLVGQSHPQFNVPGHSYEDLI